MKNTSSQLNRFIEAQERDYATALNEIKNSRKKSHWIWYIFPQIHGLGHTETSRFYAISGLDEAHDYLAHPILGKRLKEISHALLDLDFSNPTQVLGSPDDLKVRSSMTLFAHVPDADAVFQDVLDKFYEGEKDQRTIDILAT